MAEKEIFNIIKSIITDLKHYLDKSSASDIKLKLKLISEIKECAKSYNSLLDEEVKRIWKDGAVLVILSVYDKTFLAKIIT